MFENLTDKLQRVFKDLRGEGKLSEQNIEAALKQIRMALLEADVNFKVVKELVAAIREKALGQEVLTSFSPTEQVVKIVKDELVGLLGGKESRLRFANDPPSHFLIVGLQGSGKTTSTGKLARWLAKQGRRPLMVSVDVYRPAAREQLRVLASQLDLPIYTGKPEETTPLELAKGARREANQTGRDVVLIDTAGRLHVDDELMVELEQLRAEFEPSEILFVADAMTGQDAVKSAAEFHERLSITGVVLTKMDGDARGGAALSIRHVTKRPVKFIGTGEKLRRSGTVLSRTHRVADSGDGRRDVSHRESRRADRSKASDRDAAKGSRQRLHARGFSATTKATQEARPAGVDSRDVASSRPAAGAAKRRRRPEGNGAH